MVKGKAWHLGVRPSYAVSDGDAYFPRCCLMPALEERAGESNPALSSGILEVELASNIHDPVCFQLK